MNKKLFFQYLGIGTVSVVIGSLTMFGTMIGLVGLFSLYITIRFLVDGFKTNKENKVFYLCLIGYLIFIAVFSPPVADELTMHIEGIFLGFSVWLLFISLLIALPYIWFLYFLNTENLIQKTRCWYFIISPLVLIPLTVLLTYFA